MKNLTFLLFFAIFSTSMLYAQQKEKMKTVPVLELEANYENTTISEDTPKVEMQSMPTVMEIESFSKTDIISKYTSKEEMQAVEIEPFYEAATLSEDTAKDDLATKKLLEENAKKSKIAKAEREQQTEAVRKRLQKSKNAKAQAKAKKAQQERYKKMKLDEAGNPINNNSKNK